ncbi:MULTISPECIES: glyoxalase/bleomycin resistance/extradiol dioxygenase family protein [unclassified Pseudofrankia]|uniref:VOC family protein n=1 Tax=unclassified Pseudofrankia TaxID=2994372 RepID=UPI0008DB1A86|nr:MULTISPECIES: VOC family protein [unclassified Pseudofrankia]MDT3444309.1 VOC family protein [Pseudofrankia sp. BMG5.37]OHV43360.1 glyoxalase [Pseudofrankia sp. BMG5.36]
MTTDTSHRGDTTATTTGPTPAVSPVPAGYTTLTPFFVVNGAEQAIAFYEAVLGARVVGRNDTPDGKVAHCELEVANGRMQLSDPAPDHHLVAASGGDDVSRSTVAYLPDVDAAYARAVQLGAKGYGEPSTFVTGDRFAAFLDPWGHRWAVMTRVEDVDPAEAQRRVDAWLAESADADGTGPEN